MVYHPTKPIFDVCDLISGVLMIVSASVAMKKIREGSKNRFAYVLLSFTVLLGLSYVGITSSEVF